MDDLKIPVFLLICLIGGVGFYFYNRSQNPEKPIVKPKKNIEQTLSEEELKEQKKQEKEKAEAELVKNVKQFFDKGDYDKTIENLSGYKDSDNYDIQRMIAYSLASKKEFDKAILAFERVLKIRKVPADGYSLGYLYEVTGRFSAAASLYTELAELNLPPNLKRNILEGIARISEYLPDNEDLYKYIQNLVNDYPDSKDGIISIIKYKQSNNLFDDIESLAAQGNEHFSEDYSYNYQLARLFDASGDYKNALAYYKKCTKIKSENYTPFFDCYNLLKKANKPEDAIKALEQFIDGGQIYSNIFFDASLQAKNYKMYRQAFRLYLASVVSDSSLLGKEDEGLVSDVERYYKENGDETEKKYINAFISYLNGDYSSAISEVNDIKEKLDNSIYKKDYKLLLEACEAILAKDKKRDEEIMAYENYLKAQEEAEKARKEAEENRKVSSAKTSGSNGKSMHGLSDNDIRAMVLKNQNNFDIQMQAAKEFLNRGKLSDAENYFKNATVVKNKAYEPFYQLAKIYSMKNDFIKSQANIEEAVKRNPSDINSLSFASSVCLRNNDYEKSRYYAEATLQYAPSNTLAKITLAKVDMAQGDFASAESLIDSALVEEKSNILRYELENIKKQIKENSQK